ncbi:MAG: hypothetical protein LBL95_08675 [Deltaproteobacteria bacterium]|jgi:hypothetical protein|nr:hypothetical protein [Deltaproteobacteria bacterium]
MSTKDLLESINISELLDFLTDYASHDRKFDNAVHVRFGRLDFDREVNKIGHMIEGKLSIDRFDNYHSYYGYIDVDTREIDAEIQTRLQQGHIRLAFACYEEKYRKFLDVFEYQAECEISDEAEICIERMAEVAQLAKDAADQDYIFDHCLALCRLDTARDYGADYEDRFLRIAAQFIAPTNRAEFEAELSKHETGWGSDTFKVIRLDIVRRLDGERAADDYIEGNLATGAIREIAYDAAMARQDYARAEQLCLTVPDEPHGYPSRWRYKLLAAYEKTGDQDKQAGVLEQILLNGDLGYYDKLKSLLTKLGRWKAGYPALLEKCEEQLSYSGYMGILDKENELGRLMEQVRRHRETVFSYGQRLSAKYYDEVRELFTALLNAWSAAAKNRKAYAELSSRIASFAKAGYAAQANGLIAEYKLSHRRQPAFVDELNKLGKL